ncbi:MAG: 3-dehydroquinate dehydratase [Melioribacteraceae bacterium]|nr:3-dehydroquinate dehydratase [Melioribacteraceae bacterium]
MKIIVINGPNLNMLHLRDPIFYGKFDLEMIEKLLESEFSDVQFEFYQSNHEGEIVELIQKSGAFFDGLLLNPGGYAHTSVAIRDALELCPLPKIEVHLSNLSSRDDFRQTLITAPKCNGYISGFNELSYVGGIYLLKKLIRKKNA